MCANVSLSHCPLGDFHAFLSSADFFQNQHLQKIISGIPSECQTDWIQIRPDILSGLICVQTVCKSYQQMTLEPLLIAPWEIFHAFLSSADFFKIKLYQKNSFRNTIQVSNRLDPDQVRCFVWPDLGSNCLQ